jgi:hypothetical protein
MLSNSYRFWYIYCKLLKKIEWSVLKGTTYRHDKQYHSIKIENQIYYNDKLLIIDKHWS